MIYFIQNTETKAIKIGYTEKDPKKRLRSLQTGSSAPLQLLYIMEGDQNLEKKFHKALSLYNLEGEWFVPNIRIWVIVLYHLMMGGGFQGHDFLHYHAKNLGLPEEVYYHILEADDQEMGLTLLDDRLV